MPHTIYHYREQSVLAISRSRYLWSAKPAWSRGIAALFVNGRHNEALMLFFFQAAYSHATRRSRRSP